MSKLIIVSYLDIFRDSASKYRIYSFIDFYFNNELIELYGKNGVQYFVNGKLIREQKTTHYKSILKGIREIRNSEMLHVYNIRSIHAAIILIVAALVGCSTSCDVTEWHRKTGLLRNFDVYFRMKFINKLYGRIVIITPWLKRLYPRGIIIPPVFVNQYITIEYFAARKRLVYFGDSGGGEKDNIDYITSKWAELNLESLYIGPDSDNIENNFSHVYSWMPREKMYREILKSSDVLVIIRKQDLLNSSSFSTKFGEALSQGMRIICTAFPGLEIVQESIRRGQVLVIDNYTSNETIETFLSSDLREEYPNPLYAPNFKNELLICR